MANRKKMSKTQMRRHIHSFCGIFKQKPGGKSDNHERLFAGNGLLLTPTIDHLFDRGFISFENSGELLISPVAHEAAHTKLQNCWLAWKRRPKWLAYLTDWFILTMRQNGFFRNTNQNSVHLMNGRIQSPPPKIS